MLKEILFKINSNLKTRLTLCIFLNIILLIILYLLPINTEHSICIYKFITGKECWNCGMTKAFLSILHFNFNQAIQYNWKVILVFPYIVIIYIYAWIKYIFKRSEKNGKIR